MESKFAEQVQQLFSCNLEVLHLRTSTSDKYDLEAEGLVINAEILQGMKSLKGLKDLVGQPTSLSWPGNRQKFLKNPLSLSTPVIVCSNVINAFQIVLQSYPSEMFSIT